MTLSRRRMLRLLALVVPVSAISCRLDWRALSFSNGAPDLVVIDGWILLREDLKRVFPDAA